MKDDLEMKEVQKEADRKRAGEWYSHPLPIATLPAASAFPGGLNCSHSAQCTPRADESHRKASRPKSSSCSQGSNRGSLGAPRNSGTVADAETGGQAGTSGKGSSGKSTTSRSSGSRSFVFLYEWRCSGETFCGGKEL